MENSQVRGAKSIEDKAFKAPRNVSAAHRQARPGSGELPVFAFGHLPRDSQVAFLVTGSV